MLSFVCLFTTCLRLCPGESVSTKQFTWSNQAHLQCLTIGKSDSHMLAPHVLPDKDTMLHNPHSKCAGAFNKMCIIITDSWKLLLCKWIACFADDQVITSSFCSGPEWKNNFNSAPRSTKSWLVYKKLWLPAPYVHPSKGVERLCTLLITEHYLFIFSCTLLITEH